MKLHNEFTVDAPLDRTWDVLRDIQRVAGCLPGAEMNGAGEDGVHRGSMKVKLGPMTTTYTGAARLVDVDEDTYTARIVVDAREQKGQGTASATITNRLERRGSATHVTAETDLNISGRAAQFGRGIMEDVASAMLAEFARRLEHEILQRDAAAPGSERPPAGEVAGDGGRALDVGRVLTRSVPPRIAAAGGLLAVIGTVIVVLARRRRLPRT